MSSPEHPIRRYSPLAQLLISRIREFTREPEALFWVYGFPIVLTIALGIAFRNQPVEQVVVDVAESSQADATRDALASAETPERFKATIYPDEQARLRLRTGKTDLVVFPKQDSQKNKDPAEGARAHYEYLFDPTRPQSVLARNAVDDQLQRAAGRRDIAETTAVKLDETGGRYIDFLIPGLLGLSLMGGGLWGVGFVTVDMRIRKLLKRFLATPMKKWHFLCGIIGSRLTFMLPEVLFLLLFARLAFGVVNRGSYAAVLFLILIGALMFSGIGLLVASRAKTIEAVSGLMNLVQLPMWILSGVFFSSERFPEAAQPFIRLLPLTPLIEALRAVMLEGATLTSQWPRIAIMAGWGSVTFLLALRLFRWR